MTSRIFFILVAIITIVFIYRNVRKNQISQDESILWMIGAIVILIFGIWPELIIILADTVGIDYAPSLLFLLGLLFLFMFSLRSSQNISRLRERNKELIQNSALLEKRIRDLETKIDQIQNTTDKGDA
ncbi:MAG: DUF2304 domain-containing protein [Eubacteriaceae bacterium]|nr:DUF2304 domain-containing protein [Eubacteriaceae bacterium]